MISGIKKFVFSLFVSCLIISLYADNANKDILLNNQPKFVVLNNYPEKGPALNTLRYGLFYVKDKSTVWERLSPFFKTFYKKRISGEIKVLKKHPALRYNLWLNDKKSDLVFIIPGTGGSFAGFGPVAMANLFYSNGYSAVVISNSFNWEFMEAAGTTVAPGCTLADSADVRRALERLNKHLNKQYKGHFNRKILLGSSMGALQVLFIKDYYSQHPQSPFERYIAINPPVDMFYAIKQIDNFYKTSIDWSKNNIQEKVKNLVVSYMNLMSGNSLDSAPVITALEKGRKQGKRTVFQYKITDKDAKFLIGLNFHLNLVDVIYSIFMRDLTDAIGVEKSDYDQREIYKKIEMFDFDLYLEKILLPNFKKLYGNSVSKEQVIRSSGLKYIQKSLKNADDIRILHNQDDFLLGDGDLDWLKKTFGSRLTLFSVGGHLGNLYFPEVKQNILQAAKE
jgi:hypothetical protein